MKKEKTNAGSKVSISDADLFTGASLYYGDCFDLMNKWVINGYAHVVDLICLDPSFNSKSNYNILFGESNGVPVQIIEKFDLSPLSTSRALSLGEGKDNLGSIWDVTQW